jgi:spore coat polysaccharide biosynthesis predicted glycosyltransferase SpsG
VEVIGAPGFAAWGQEAFGQRDLNLLRFRWEDRHLDTHLFNADLAITAGGIAAYEALCAGTPLLALSHDHLQQMTIRTLHRLEACIDLGPGDELTPMELVRTLSGIELDADKRRLLSRHGRQIVDGQGCERVARIIRQAVSQNPRYLN